jgi:6-phosphogluconolactonase
MSSDPRVRVFDDSGALVAAAAEAFTEAVAAAQAARGFASVSLTGGSNGIALLRALRDRPIDWTTVDVYFGDERFVDSENRDRNEVQAREALLDHVDAPHVFRFPSSDELSGDGDLAARVYAERLSARSAERGFATPVPVFDVYLLGMGGEGHINSLFPHTSAVAERDALVVAVENSPKPPPRRLTMTLPVFAHAERVWLLVAGADKAEAVAAGVGGASPLDWPCAGAHGTVETVWFLDRAAASQLP